MIPGHTIIDLRVNAPVVRPQPPPLLPAAFSLPAAAAATAAHLRFRLWPRCAGRLSPLHFQR